MFQSFALLGAIVVLGMFFTGHIRPSDFPAGAPSGQNFVYLLVLPYVALMFLIFKLDRD